MTKILATFAVPSNLLIGMSLFGVLLLYTPAERIGVGIVTIALGLLALLGLSPISNAIRYILEDRFPEWNSARRNPDGIVVLAGGSHRVSQATELAVRYPNAVILFSGGNAYSSGQTEIDQAVRNFVSAELPVERLLVEPYARNTTENALFSKALAQPKPGQLWLLVTSALHMPRAIGAFRRVGFSVEAYPVDRRIKDADVLVPSPSFVRGLWGFDIGAYEWCALLVYWITGRTSQLFPRSTE